MIGGEVGSRGLYLFCAKKRGWGVVRSGGGSVMRRRDRCVRTYVRTYLRLYVRTYVCTYVRMYVRTYVRTYVCTYVRMYARKYVRTHELVAYRHQ